MIEDIYDYRAKELLSWEVFSNELADESNWEQLISAIAAELRIVAAREYLAGRAARNPEMEKNYERIAELQTKLAVLRTFMADVSPKTIERYKAHQAEVSKLREELAQAKQDAEDNYEQEGKKAGAGAERATQRDIDLIKAHIFSDLPERGILIGAIRAAQRKEQEQGE